MEKPQALGWAAALAFDPMSLLSSFSWSKTLHLSMFPPTQPHSETQRHSKRRTKICIYSRTNLCIFHRRRNLWTKWKCWEYPHEAALDVCTTALQPRGWWLTCPAELQCSRKKTLMGSKNGWREHVPSPGLPGSLGCSTGVAPFPRAAGRIILLMLGVPWLIQRCSDSTRENAQRLGDRGHTELLPASSGERTLLATSSLPPSCPTSSVKLAEGTKWQKIYLLKLLFFIFPGLLPTKLLFAAVVSWIKIKSL